MQALNAGSAQRRIATKGRPGTGFVGSLWSALQTHLQGVDWAMLAIMPEESHHRAALLSRLSVVKIARSAKESKLKSPPAQSECRRRSATALQRRVELVLRNR
jgi:hypothetical protein